MNCLLCEKVQIVWSHFKLVQDGYVHDLFFSFMCRNICKELGHTGPQSSSDIKARTVPAPIFHNKRQLHCGLLTAPLLEDVRSPPITSWVNTKYVFTLFRPCTFFYQIATNLNHLHGEVNQWTKTEDTELRDVHDDFFFFVKLNMYKWINIKLTLWLLLPETF